MEAALAVGLVIKELDNTTLNFLRDKGVQFGCALLLI